MELSGFDSPGFNSDFFGKQKQAVKQAPKKKKNFIESLLPAIGGTGGSVGGAALGTALLPGVGTLAGALLGGALGGGGGKVAENALEHESLTHGVAGEAALNAAFGAGPIRAGKFGIQALQGAKSGAGLADALTNAGLNVAGNGAGRATTRSIVGQKLENTGGKLMNSQTNLTRAEMRKIGANAPEAFNLMNKNYGLHNLDDIAEVASNVTGSTGVHSSAVKGIIESGKGIDTGDFHDTFVKLLDTKAPLVNESKRKNLLTQLRYSVEKMYSDHPLNPLAQPSPTYEVAQNFRNEAARLRSLPTPTAADKQLADVYDGMRKHIEEKLYSQTHINAADAGIDAELGNAKQVMQKQYRQLANNTGVNTAKGKAYLKLANEASQVKDIKDLRSIQKPWVTMSKIDNATAQSQGNAASKLGQAANGRGVIRGATNAVLNSTSPVLGSKLSKTGLALQGGANANAFGVKAVGKRVGGVGLANALINQPMGGGSVDIPQGDTGNIQPGNTFGGAQNPQGADDGSAGQQYTLENALADIKRDPKNADDYMKLYQFVSDATATKAPKSLSSTQQTQVNNAMSGLQDLQNIAQIIQHDPSAITKDAIPGGSIARRLTGTTDYEASKQNVVDVIARLRSGAVISTEEAKRYMGLLPQAGDTTQSANQKLNRLANLLSSFANPQPTGASLSDALSGLQ
jgi:hypothetical protein